MNKDLKTIAYKGFLEFFVGSYSCVDFLKAIMPQGFCESIYDEFWKKYDSDTIYFIKSFIKMCGLAKQEIPQFDKFDNNNSNSILYGHNDLYRFEIEYRYKIKYNNTTIRFYKNDGKHFLTLKTYANHSGSSKTVERYGYLVRECYLEDNDKPNVFSIGKRCIGAKKYGFFVLVTGNLYWCPYKHEETLSPNENFKDFYESIKNVDRGVMKV